MCGIAGVLNLRPDLAPPTREPLLRMIGALAHRGPDARGLYRDRCAGLGHTRLAVVDLQAGDQPICGEDGTQWLVFNGEIFNHVELRRELRALGHQFRTRSDSEVIVHSVAEWGLRALSRFNGQWAFALWDAVRRRLILARDPVGVRPLYLAVHAGRLWFASEAKALLVSDPGLRRAFDPQGLSQTFTFWSPVAPRTCFAGIEELEPGHARVFEGGRVEEHTFWQPDFPSERPAGRSLDESSQEVFEALQEATRLRLLRADVPVGCYLSGGLDSALVAALAQRIRGGGLRTFSVAFEDRAYDESDAQARVVAHLGTRHTTLRITESDIARVFPAVVWHAERPLLRTAPAPMFALSQHVRDEGLRVVLTGEGADEVFAGYDLFREGAVRRFWARAPHSTLRPRLLERLYPYLARSPVRQQAMARQFFGRELEAWRSPGFAHQTRWRTTRALQRLFAPALSEALRTYDPVGELLACAPATLSGWSPLAQDQFFEMRTLLPGYILSAQGDRMLMAHAVEGRFPFLDPNVIRLAATLPDRHKLAGLDEKHVLKRLARAWLPTEIAQRKKQPYRAPDARCFTRPGAAEWVESVLSSRALSDAGVFEPRAVAMLWRKCRQASADQPLSNSDDMALVGVVSTQLLYEQLLRQAPTAVVPRPLQTCIERVHA